MSAETSFRAGDLEQTRLELNEAIRKDPADASQRIFLFQLLAVLGEWERAGTQLEVLRELDRSALPMVETYRDALRCEALRAEVFAGRKTPLVLGEPEPWMALILEALRLTAEGQPDRAAPLREQAFEQAAAVPGTIDGQSFRWIADGDTRLGPVLELILQGRYFWVPFERVRLLRVEEPTDLRDLVWTPVEIVWSNGGQAVGLIPTRYAGSESTPDVAIRLARRTEWEELGPAGSRGLGQRMWATDEGEYPLLQVRSLHLGPSAARAPNVAGAAD